MTRMAIMISFIILPLSRPNKRHFKLLFQRDIRLKGKRMFKCVYVRSALDASRKRKSRDSFPI